MIDGGPEFLPLLAGAAHDLPEPDPGAAGSIHIRTDEPHQHNAGHDQRMLSVNRLDLLSGVSEDRDQK